MDDPERRTLEDHFGRLVDGDRSAIEPVFGALVPVVRRFVSRLLPSEEVDDVAQLAVEKIFARAGEYDRERPLLPWVLTIANWECRTARTRARRQRSVPLEHADHIANEGRSPEGDAIDRELLEAAIRSLHELSEEDQKVLREAFFGEPSNGPVDATTRKRKERAMGRLRGMFMRLYGW